MFWKHSVNGTLLRDLSRALHGNARTFVRLSGMYPGPKLVWEFSVGIAFFIGDKVGGVMFLSLVLVFFNEEYLIALVDLIPPRGGRWSRRSS